MKTLRIDLADILDDIGAPSGSTATATVQYVDTNGVSRDLHLVDGTIVVSVPRQLPAFSEAGVVDVEVYETDDVLVREVDHGHLLKVRWVITTPDGAKHGNTCARNSRRVAITSDLPDPVSLASLSTPTPVPPYTGGYVLPAELDALDDRVVELEANGVGGGGGYLDHGSQSGAVSYSATIGTHALTSTAATAVTLTGTDGQIVSVYDSGVGPLTVEGTAVTVPGAVVCHRVAGTWYVYPLGASVEPGDPSDVTAPTAGTIAGSSITSSSFTLTVTGATDETALHATPYAFSTNGGSSYSTWQAGATFAASGLTAATGYSCRHKVRDAALNEATGAAVTVTTGAEAPAATPPVAGYSAFYDSLTPASITTSGGKVTQWADLSGNGHHLAQADVAKQPVTATVGGRTVIDLSLGEWLATANIPSGANSVRTMVVIAGYRTGGATGGGSTDGPIWAAWHPAANEIFGVRFKRGATTWWAGAVPNGYGGLIASTTLETAGLGALTVTSWGPSTAGAGKRYVNSTSDSYTIASALSSDPAYDDPGPFRLNYGTNGTNGTDVFVLAAILYPTGLTDGDLTTLRSWAATRYGTP